MQYVRFILSLTFTRSSENTLWNRLIGFFSYLFTKYLFSGELKSASKFAKLRTSDTHALACVCVQRAISSINTVHVLYFSLFRPQMVDLTKIE